MESYCEKFISLTDFSFSSLTGSWTSSSSSSLVPPVLVSHEGSFWGPQASLFPELQVQTTASVSGEDDQHTHSRCPEDADAGWWGLSTQHLVLSHHQEEAAASFDSTALLINKFSRLFFLSWSSGGGGHRARR